MRIGSRFYSGILLPSLAAVLLFLVAIYLIVIPNYRDNLMDRKRETIRELTNTAWSVLQKLDAMTGDSLSVDQAREEAAMIISDMRYGVDMKDYFWITDTIPVMIMHPYRPVMNGMNLSEYRDSRGKNFFVDIVQIVNESGDGYIDYKWQWKDDSLTVVSKLSYVKIFKPWGWIIGTGIYIDDVNREISGLTGKVVFISIFVTLMISALIAYLARRNFLAERQRQEAQDRLHDTMLRYKTLVEATTDGVMMIMGQEVVYCNAYLLDILGFSQQNFERREQALLETLKTIAIPGQDPGDVGLETQNGARSQEKRLTTSLGAFVDVVVYRSGFELEGKQGDIYTVKNVSGHMDVERELDLSVEKLRSIADIMHLGIFRCRTDKNIRFTDINKVACQLLGFAHESEIKNIDVLQLFDKPEQRKHVVKDIGEGKVVKNKLLRIRKADNQVLHAVVSLFPVKNDGGVIVYCDGILADARALISKDEGLARQSVRKGLLADFPMLSAGDFSRPALICQMNTQVFVAARLMRASGNSVIVVVDEYDRMVGVVTHGDINRRIVAAAESAEGQLSAVMTSPVVYADSQTLLIHALHQMIENNVSHLIVKQEQSAGYGYISRHMITALLQSNASRLLDGLENARTLPEISYALQLLLKQIGSQLDDGHGVTDVCETISLATDMVTKRVIEYALQQLGEPPAAFVFLALGSEGRREQTLFTDQDNAIIFRSEAADQVEANRRYFLRLGKIVCTELDKMGYPLCKGGVMAMHEAWCQDSMQWRSTLQRWVTKPDPEEILQVSVFFDFRPVYGDFTLSTSLQRYIQRLIQGQDVFLYHMAANIINLKLHSPDRTNTDAPPYDVKFPLLAVTSIARLWSLHLGLSERNTAERLYIVKSAGIISDSLYHDLDRTLRFLLSMRFKAQLHHLKNQEVVSNYIPLELLSDLELVWLKRSISVLKDHQRRLAVEFRIS